MLTPSINTSPSTRPPSTSSCKRFKQRTKVDFPHPDGPIIAVAPRDSTVRFTLKSACERPYQTLRLLTSTDTAYSFSARICRSWSPRKQENYQLLRLNPPVAQRMANEA